MSLLSFKVSLSLLLSLKLASFLIKNSGGLEVRTEMQAELFLASNA